MSLPCSLPSNLEALLCERVHFLLVEFIQSFQVFPSLTVFSAQGLDLQHQDLPFSSQIHYFILQTFWLHIEGVML